MPAEEQFDKEKAKAEVLALDIALNNDKPPPNPALSALPGVQLTGAEKEKYEGEMAKLYKELDDKVRKGPPHPVWLTERVSQCQSLSVHNCYGLSESLCLLFMVHTPSMLVVSHENVHAIFDVFINFRGRALFTCTVLHCLIKKWCIYLKLSLKKCTTRRVCKVTHQTHPDGT